MSLYHLVELAVVGGAVIAAGGAAYKRFVPRFGKSEKTGAAGCSSCSSCGSCGPASGPASVEHPGQGEQPLVFQQPRR